MDAKAGLCFCLSQTPADSSLTPEDRFSGVEAQMYVCVCVCGGGGGGGGVQVKSLTYSFSHQLILQREEGFHTITQNGSPSANQRNAI